MEINATGELLEILMHNTRAIESNSIRTQQMQELTNLRNACDVFSEKSFRDIRKICASSSSRGLQAKLNDITIMLYTMAGRIMITIKHDSGDTVTLVGGEEDSPRSNQMAGLQSVFGDTDKALDMLEVLTHYWYKFYDETKDGYTKTIVFTENENVKIAGL